MLKTNSWNLLGTALIGAVLLFGLACGSDDDDDGSTAPDGKGHPPAEMVGSWTFASATVDGNSADLATVLEWVSGAVEAHLSVLENGAYVYEEVDTRGGQLWFESGFVYVDGGEIDVNIQLDGDGPIEETSFLTYTLVEEVLTLREEDEGTVVVFTLVPR